MTFPKQRFAAGARADICQATKSVVAGGLSRTVK